MVLTVTGEYGQSATQSFIDEVIEEVARNAQIKRGRIAASPEIQNKSAKKVG